MMRRTRFLPVLLPVLLLAACNTQPRHDPPPPDGIDDKPLHLKNDEIHLDLIQQMLDQGQYYAALAHIEDAKRTSNSEQLRLLEADARRHLGQRDQADKLYRGLMGTQYAAQAYHGYGMLYTDSDLGIAIGNLGRAVELAPTNVDFRNDLGYALMMAARYTEAYTQLSTAAELAPAQTRSQKNLIILWLAMGGKDNEALADKMARGLKLPPEDVQQLRYSAQKILVLQWLVGGYEVQAQKLAKDTGMPPEEMQQLRDTAQKIRSTQQTARAVKPAGQR